MGINPRFEYPPPIARTLGFDLVEAGERTATIEIVVDLAKHANPMGTVHGGVLCDVADAAIGTAHATGLGARKHPDDRRTTYGQTRWKSSIGHWRQ